MEPLAATAKTKALIAVSGWKGDNNVPPYMLCKSYVVWVGVFVGLEAAVLLWKPLLLTATSFTVMYAMLQFALFFILMSKIELHFKEIGPSSILRSLDPTLPRSVNEGNHHLRHQHRGMPLICGNINFPTLRPPAINGRNLLSPHRMLSPSYSNSDSETYSSTEDQYD